MDAGQRHGTGRARAWLALVLVAALGGCTLAPSSAVWSPPTSPSPASHADGNLAAAEDCFEQGIALDADANPAAIDAYYQAAVNSWPHHAVRATITGDEGAELYRASVRKLLDAASRYQRFDSRIGITLCDGRQVPVRYCGFLWQSADFHCFQPVGSYATPELLHRYTSPGVGVEYVVLTRDVSSEPFLRPNQPFAATAVLQPACAASGEFSLDLYDPLRIGATEAGLPLARDLTAPIAYAASQEGREWLDGFLDPGGSTDVANLRMAEPFQPGKIPIVLVHGLASSPITWSHLENDLRAQPEIFARYQVFTFRYDTGEPFLTSANELRQQFASLRQTYDPGRGDAAFAETVLIGHSLGGLVSKLQVTASGNQLWAAAATVPFDTIRIDNATRTTMERSFFFSPSPDISRVIFIATPHRGSNYARRCVGRLSSALVNEPPERTARHAQFVRDNPGVFRAEMERGVPTSVDLLEPSSQILLATDRLPYRQGLALHSIIGDDRWTCSQGRSDGVVAVASARLGGVQSELFVDASHTEIQRRTETSTEVIRILMLHAASVPAGGLASCAP